MIGHPKNDGIDLEFIQDLGYLSPMMASMSYQILQKKIEGDRVRAPPFLYLYHGTCTGSLKSASVREVTRLTVVVISRFKRRGC